MKLLSSKPSNQAKVRLRREGTKVRKAQSPQLFFVIVLSVLAVLGLLLPHFITEDSSRTPVTGVRSSEQSPLNEWGGRASPEKRRPEEPWHDRTVARGPNALPMAETPALVGAKRGHIQCDENVDALAYWNDPQGDRDRSFRSPFAPPAASPTKYLTFEPDRGGWNNIRMSMENMVVIAAASGRTLVLPPDQPLYLLKNDPKRKQRGFRDFFPVQSESFNRHLPVITAAEFLRREGGPDGQVPIPAKMREEVLKVQSHCEHRAKSKISCFKLYDYYRERGYVPAMEGSHQCMVFDEGYLKENRVDDLRTGRASKFCARRKAVYFDKKMQDTPLVHFQTSEKDHRILTHFYAFVLFTNPSIDNFYKRFIRDYFHYHDEIFCAAGKIVNALQTEGKKRGFDVDSEGGGGYSSMHIRRGDFQWKNMKIPAKEWYENTKEHWQQNEIIYVATDEKNKTFFEPLAAHLDLRFLDDFWELAGLGNVDPNYFGMIDTIVASRGSIFVGTFFSSFTAYAGRMRGYHGMSGKLMWYGQKGHKADTHQFVYPRESYSSREFPVGWIGIDGDKEVAPEMGF